MTHRIVLLEGDLGAGKTTLVKQMIRHMGSEDKGSSPSFSIINEYRTVSGDPVYHMDLYRIEDQEEALNIGIEEYLYSGCYCFIEWPGVIDGMIDGPYHHILIEIQEDNNRRIELN